MRLVRLAAGAAAPGSLPTAPDAARPAMIDAAGAIRDLSGVIADIEAETLGPAALDRLHRVDPQTLPVLAASVETVAPEAFRAPLRDTPNFFCIGLNYARHAAETGAEAPREPILFSKATSALAGPNDRIELPPGATQADWEVELGVVIGQAATRVSEEDALSHIAGYLCVNDLSERSYQAERGGQWIKGKSLPGFGKIGPWLVTADAIENPQALDLGTRLNGVAVQASNTADMIFGVAEIIAYLSRFMTLRPGDVIATGTPEGVGLGMTPPRYLRDGDRVECWVDGLGAQNAAVRALAAPNEATPG